MSLYKYFYDKVLITKLSCFGY